MSIGILRCESGRLSFSNATEETTLIAYPPSTRTLLKYFFIHFGYNMQRQILVLLTHHISDLMLEKRDERIYIMLHIPNEINKYIGV